MIRHALVYLLVFGCVSCILRRPTSDKKFMALHHQLHGRFEQLLINKVHTAHWKIHYNFVKCAGVNEETQKKFTQVVTKFIQSWLQPLREYTNRPIVNDFRYHLDADWNGASFGITHTCDIKAGSANASVFPPIGIETFSDDLKLTWRWITTMLHELGHLFGLADTYLRVIDIGKPGLDTGGRDSTKGSQPLSIMSGFTLALLKKDWDQPILAHPGVVTLNEDDKNGIIWLYKYIHEGLPLRDCFFPNYELEASPLGCVPKYPLIFELKHSTEKSSLFVIREDENLDVNARDADGMTALHHAVLYGYKRVVEELIKRDDIKPYLSNKKGQSPMQLAKELKHDDLAQLIAAHPKALPVDAKGKKVTTWGEIKRGDN